MRSAKGCWNCKYSYVYGGLFVDRRRCSEHIGKVIPFDDWNTVCEDWKDKADDSGNG